MEIYQLSPEDELVLEPILASLSRRMQCTLTLSLLVDRWKKFVFDVEEGYDDSIYEYTNDISIRDLLQGVVDKCPLVLCNKLIKSLQIWDDRFKKATRVTTCSVLPDREKSQAWWWFRIPIKLSPELENDLKVEGLI